MKSLENKILNLGELNKTQLEYQECSIMGFTETAVRIYSTLKHLSMLLSDKDCRQSWRNKGGGIAPSDGVILVMLLRRIHLCARY